LSERYGNHKEWVSRVENSAGELVSKGYLLPRDRDTIVSETMSQKF